ncbi:unnamed protein product [Phytophthora lilii]|uniref:Unnamed protein product n=1 Tax=Phytophthora lilii TaxID=2077276 RepID=A0A9W6YLQ7_9STRA|nr:unnamed protein product [Phytophthora lilii]
MALHGKSQARTHQEFVHVSRLKPVNEYGDRPKTRLAPDITENSRLDFDEELLPEDSWEPDHLTGKCEVEAILDDRTPMSTSTERAVREFKVKWVGYDDPTWEPASKYLAEGFSTTICVENGGTNDSRWSKSPTKTDTDNSK